MVTKELTYKKAFENKKQASRRKPVFYLFLAKSKTEPNIKIIPKTILIESCSEKTVILIKVATAGSTVARIDARPLSTQHNPVV